LLRIAASTSGGTMPSRSVRSGPAHPGGGEGADAVLRDAGAVAELEAPLAVVVDKAAADLSVPGPGQREGNGHLEPLAHPPGWPSIWAVGGVGLVAVGFTRDRERVGRPSSPRCPAHPLSVHGGPPRARRPRRGVDLPHVRHHVARATAPGRSRAAESPLLDDSLNFYESFTPRVHAANQSPPN